MRSTRRPWSHAAARAVALATAAALLMPPTPADASDASGAGGTEPAVTVHSPVLADTWQGWASDIDTDQDGDTVAWLARRTGERETVRVASAAGRTVEFTAGGGRVSQPTLDDAGDQVAFLTRATDTAPRTVALGSVAAGTVTATAPTPAGADAVAAAQAGDGTAVALIYRDTATAGAYHLAIWDTAAATLQPWATWPTAPMLLTDDAAGIAVSDDASTVAYLAAGSDGYSRCHPHVVTVAGGTLTDVDAGVDGVGRPLDVSCTDVNAGVSQTRPVLSGDGRAVAFAAHPTLDQQSGPDATDSRPSSNIVYTRRLDTGATTRVSPTPATVGLVEDNDSDALPTGISDDGSVVAWYDYDRGALPYVAHDRSVLSPTGFVRDVGACSAACATTVAGLSRVTTTASGNPAWGGLYSSPRRSATMLAVSGDGAHTAFAAADPGLVGPDVTDTDATFDQIYLAAPGRVSVSAVGDVALDETGSATIAVSASGLSGVATAAVFDATGRRVATGDLDVPGTAAAPGDGTGGATFDIFRVAAGKLTVVVTDRSGATAASTGTAVPVGGPVDPDDPTMPPDDVTGLDVRPGVGSATLTWQAPARVQRTEIHAFGGGGGQLVTVGADTSHVTVTHLREGVQVTFVVQAINAAGASAPAEVVLAGSSTTVRSPMTVRRHPRQRAHAHIAARAQTADGAAIARESVWFQVSRDGRRWRTFRTVRSDSRGDAAAVLTLSAPCFVRAVFPGAGQALGSTSPRRYIQVRSKT